LTCYVSTIELLATKGQFTKIQGYDNVDYKQVNRFVAHASSLLKAYEDKKQKVENALQMWKATHRSIQGSHPKKLLNLGDWVRDAITKAKENGNFINEDVSNIASIANLVLP